MATGWRARQLLVDIGPLRRSREFRLLYSGQALSVVGTQLTAVAAPVQVYALTESSLAVGLLGAVQLVPLILGSLVGGALADAYDRRKLMLLAQLLLAATSAGLVLNTVIGSPRLWLVYVLTGCQAALGGVDNPTRAASTPVVV